MENSHSPSGRAAAPATTSGQPHGDDLPRKALTIRDRRYRKATAKMSRATAGRKRGTQGGTVERSLVRRCRSLPGSGFQRIVHDLLGLAHDDLKVRLAGEAFRVDFVDI